MRIPMGAESYVFGGRICMVLLSLLNFVGVYVVAYDLVGLILGLHVVAAWDNGSHDFKTARERRNYRI